MRRLTRLLPPLLAVCLIALMPSPAAGQLVPYAGPVDVAFVIDDTNSMVDALASLQTALPAILDRIEGASASGTAIPDYRLALVTFKDDLTIRLNFSANNRNAFALVAATLSANAGGNDPEASDEALNTVIHALPQRPHQDVDFAPPFRPEALKVIILLTDSPPGGFDDLILFPDDIDNAHLRATEAAAAGIKIAAIFTPQTESQEVTAQDIMSNYATVTGGAYSKDWPFLAGGAILGYFTGLPPLNRPPIALCAPVIDTVSCPADANVDAGSYDVDGTIESKEQSPPGPYDQATTDVTLTVTDNGGQTGSCQTVVTATLCAPPGPTIQAPTLISVEATGPAGAIATFDVTAADDQGNPLPVSCSPASGALFPLGPTAVMCTATDTHSQTRTETFTVDVADTTPPVLHGVPADVTIPATTAAGAAYGWTATADDIVDGAVAVTCNRASNSLFPVGTTAVACTATDAHGNAATGHFAITVLALPDTVAPVMTVSGPGVIEATGPGGAIATFFASATDAVDGSVPVLCTPVSASMFPLGDTVVTCSATDAHHNVASASLTVSVVDRTAPALSLPAAITANSVNGTSAIVSFTATAIDLVDGAVVPVCVPASGFAFPIGTTPVTCMAMDAHGNGWSGVFAVTVTTVTVVPPTVRCVPGSNPGGHNTDNDEAGFYRVEALPASDGAAIRISLGAFELSNRETIKITQTRPRTAVRLMNTMKGMRHFEVPPEFEIVAIDGAGRHASARCGDGDGRGEDRRER